MKNKYRLSFMIVLIIMLFIHQIDIIIMDIKVGEVNILDCDIDFQVA